MTEHVIATVPEANQTIVEGELRRALRQTARRRERYGPQAGNQRVLLLRAAPEWRGPDQVIVDIGDGPVTATVRGCGTVLSVLDALVSRDLAEPAPSDSRYLVVLTPCEDDELGRSVLAQATRCMRSTGGIWWPTRSGPGNSTLA
jgi:hypothetical protein